MEAAKAHLRSALRAIKVRDAVTFNDKLEKSRKLMDGVTPDTEFNLLLSDTKAASKLYSAEKVVADYVRMLLKCQEPLKAQMLLKYCRPVGTDDSPHLNNVQKRLEAGLTHVNDFAAYKERYSSPTYYPDSDWSTQTSRGLNALSWAAEHPETESVLCIGPNDGLLERKLLDLMPKAVLTFAELSYGFDLVRQNLAEEFPGRVRRHTMTEDWYDWSPAGATFDLVVLFEVLEHLPDTQVAMERLALFTKPNGTALVSVPVGKKWIEDEHANDLWFQHLRAFTPNTLKYVLDQGFVESVVSEGFDGSFVAKCALPKVGWADLE